MSEPAETGRRGYSWPPFAAGHELSTLHGANSPRRVEPLADQIAASLLAHADTPAWLRTPAYAPAVRAWSRAEAVVSLLWDYLASQDIEAALGDVTTTDEDERRRKGSSTRRTVSRRVVSVLDQLHKHESRAANLRSRLGLDPLSRARLGRDIGAARFDLARAIAELDREDGTDG